jgi:hypothetical protein
MGSSDTIRVAHSAATARKNTPRPDEWLTVSMNGWKANVTCGSDRHCSIHPETRAEE